MIKITFPDGSIKEYKEGVSGLDIALTVSEGLAREVVAIKFKDQLMDAFVPLEKDGTLKLSDRAIDAMKEIGASPSENKMSLKRLPKQWYKGGFV